MYRIRLFCRTLGSRSRVSCWQCVGVWCLILAAVSAASAQTPSITDITHNPDPICLGYGTTYTAVVNGEAAAAYTWEYRCEEDGIIGLWAGDGQWRAEPTIAYQEIRIGTSRIKVTGIWSLNYPGTGQPYDYSSAYDELVEVHPADTDVITAGLGVGSTAQTADTDGDGLIDWVFMSVPMHFEPRCGTSTLGPLQFEYTLHEVLEWQAPFTGDPIGYETPGYYYYDREQRVIVDLKWFRLPTRAQVVNFENFPNGHILLDAYQTNVMNFKDCHGNWQEFEFPRRRLQMVKTGNYSFEMNLVP